MRTPLFQPNSRLFANDPSDLSNTLANVMNVLRIDASGAASLLAHEQLIPDMTVYVEPARNVAVNGTAVDFAGASSPAFTAPLSGMRIDLLVIDDAGNLSIIQNTSGAINYPQDVRAIAEVTLLAGDTEVTDDMIRDVRQFFGGGQRPPNVQVTNLAGDDADNAPTNTLYSVSSGSYTIGANAVAVYIDGIRQVIGVDFTEETTTSIRLVEPALDTQTITLVINEANGVDITTRVAKAGDTMSGNLVLPELNIETSSFRIFRTGNAMMFRDIDNPTPVSLSDLLSGMGGGVSINHEEFVASLSQTVFNLAFSYVTGSDTLLVFKNGLLQRETDDYTETSTTQVTFITPCTAGDKITFHKVASV